MNVAVNYRPDDGSGLVSTRDGAVFDPDAERWAIREGVKSVHLNFDPLALLITPSLLLEFKKTLVWYAENRSIHHMYNMFKQASEFFQFLSQNSDTLIDNISSTNLLNYHGTIDKKWNLGALAGFLKKWHALGFNSVGEDAVRVLKQLRITGHPKGVAVATMDPINGPFSDIELEAIQSSLNASYARSEVSTDDYLLAWIFMLLGQRPRQYALLKVCDVGSIIDMDGGVSYFLRVPRVKQQQVARTQFKERLITPQIGKLLVQHAERIKTQFAHILSDPNQAPLFPERNSHGLQPAGMEFHRKSDSLSLSLARILDGMNVFSERTGKLLNVTATRFRRTIGTRAAAEGHGELVIAELLDHTDTQSVGVYVQATPAIVERIDRAVAISLAPLAQAFAGIIIEDATKATRGTDPDRLIIDPRIEQSCKPMGSCGKHGFCGFMAPIACYTCQSFQAWVDGPHHAVLDFLLAERDRKLTVLDKRIASINDRTILAVADVVRQCEAIRGLSAGRVND